MANNPCIDDKLVGGLEDDWIMTFHSVGNAIIPTDSDFSEGLVGIPPTRLLLTIISHIITFFNNY